MLKADAALDALVGRVRTDGVATARLASVLAARKDIARARELFERAEALAPDNGEVRLRHRELLSDDVPHHYFGLVRDHERHTRYGAVFAKRIRPGDLVLDIGAGTGVLALMAAHAGATVVTCEKRSLLAGALVDVVARNNLADRIRVISKSSFDLEVGRDLARPADVVLWGNLANNAISPSALAAIADARDRLARRNACMIPQGGKIRLALVEDTERFRWKMGSAEGLDLSHFNRLAPLRAPLFSEVRFAVRSEPIDFLAFDARSSRASGEARASATLRSNGGRTDGVGEWALLDLDEGTSYEHKPPITLWGVGGTFHRFSRSFEMRSGDALNIEASFDHERLRVWASP